MSSENGRGTLTIRDVKEADQGAYTCEAINAKGLVFGIPDGVLTLTSNPSQGLKRSQGNHYSNRRREEVNRSQFFSNFFSRRRQLRRGPLQRGRTLRAVFLRRHHQELQGHRALPQPHHPALHRRGRLQRH